LRGKYLLHGNIDIQFADHNETLAQGRIPYNPRTGAEVRIVRTESPFSVC
jgi:hypothetical protein